MLEDFIKERFLNSSNELIADGEKPLDPIHIEDFKEFMMSSMREALEHDFDPAEIVGGIRTTLARKLGQEDAMDDADWLTDRREYWLEAQKMDDNGYSDKEVCEQIDGITELLKTL